MKNFTMKKVPRYCSMVARFKVFCTSSCSTLRARATSAGGGPCGARKVEAGSGSSPRQRSRVGAEKRPVQAARITHSCCPAPLSRRRMARAGVCPCSCHLGGRDLSSLRRRVFGCVRIVRAWQLAGWGTNPMWFIRARTWSPRRAGGGVRAHAAGRRRRAGFRQRCARRWPDWRPHLRGRQLV